MIEARLEQRSKQHFPKLVTDDGIVIDFKPEPEKHQSPILVTEEGMVTEVKLVQ